MTTNGKRNLPLWMILKCNEKLVWNPASLFSQAVAAVLNGVTIDGYTDLETIQHLNFPLHKKSEPIKIIYRGHCNILGCFNGCVLESNIHDHTEKLGHYKLWNSNCRSSRKCIVAVLPHHQETVILNEINERKRAGRILETKQYSCRRKLFE